MTRRNWMGFAALLVAGLFLAGCRRRRQRRLVRPKTWRASRRWKKRPSAAEMMAEEAEMEAASGARGGRRGEGGRCGG